MRHGAIVVVLLATVHGAPTTHHNHARHVGRKDDGNATLQASTKVCAPPDVVMNGTCVPVCPMGYYAHSALPAACNETSASSSALASTCNLTTRHQAPVCTLVSPPCADVELVAPTATSDRLCETLAPPCPIGTYTANATTDDCEPVANCTGATPYESMAPTPTSDRACVAMCPVGQFADMAAVVQDTSQGVCTNVTVCTPDVEYQVAPATTTSDTTCANVTAACSNDSYQTAQPTTTSNRQCTPYTNCTAFGMWSEVPPTPTSDVACTHALTVCQSWQVQSIPPTLTSNRVCINVDHDAASHQHNSLPAGQVVGIVMGGFLLVVIVIGVGAMLGAERRNLYRIQMRETELVKRMSGLSSAFRNRPSLQKTPSSSGGGTPASHVTQSVIYEDPVSLTRQVDAALRRGSTRYLYEDEMPIRNPYDDDDV
eukprot:m.98518 g.98518  ORF g.98518 m.98518 type:complete len:428 (-) comp10263_c0_seq1:246-1529(-)